MFFANYLWNLNEFEEIIRYKYESYCMTIYTTVVTPGLLRPDRYI